MIPGGKRKTSLPYKHQMHTVSTDGQGSGEKELDLFCLKFSGRSTSKAPGITSYRYSCPAYVSFLIFKEDPKLPLHHDVRDVLRPLLGFFYFSVLRHFAFVVSNLLESMCVNHGEVHL